MATNAFTIRITGAPPPPLTKGRGKKAPPTTQQRFNLRLTSSTPLPQLQNDVFSLFNVATSSRKKYKMEFLTGFPPMALDSSGKNNVGELGIRPNENVIVKLSLAEDTTDSKRLSKNASAKEKQVPLHEAATSRPKRAAAAAASSSFKDVIKAQEAILQADKSKPSSNKSGTASTKNKPVKKSSPKKIKIEGVGYRLSDSQAFGSPAKKAKMQKAQPLFQSKDDVATTLLSSMNGKGGNVNKFLRSAMKGAVTRSYEVSRAQVRVSAVENGDYEIGRMKSGSVLNGGVVLGSLNDGANNQPDNILGRALHLVSYGKGIEGRGRFTEEVEIFGLDALKGVIRMVYMSKPASDDSEDELEDECISDGREMLRPAAIAQMSPRILWSLVYHCSQSQPGNPNHMSVEDMLRSVMPQLDWSHLDRGGRKRVLSEKAKENLRQEKREAPENSSQNEDHDAGIRAVEGIQDSVNTRINQGVREQKANAAAARFDARDKTICDDWKLVTPTKEDEDELQECILDQHDESAGKEENAKMYSSMLMATADPCCKNWRELANANPGDVLYKLIQGCQHSKIDPPSLDSIRNWIDAAQVRSLEEIMLEILDGDSDLLYVLCDKAHASSPRNLTYYQNDPKQLLTDMECTNYGEEDVLRWISRARVALSVCTWLEEFSYTTPIA